MFISCVQLETKAKQTPQFVMILTFGFTPSSEMLPHLNPDSHELSLTSVGITCTYQHLCPGECFEQFRSSSSQEYKQ